MKKLYLLIVYLIPSLVHSQDLNVMGNIILPSSTGNKQIYMWSAIDPNWRIGMSVTPGFTTSLATSHVQYTTYYTGAGQGYALGVNGGQSSFEIQGSNHQAFFRGNIGIGTTTPSSKLQVLSSTPIGAGLNSEVLITRFSTSVANQQSLDLKLRKYSTTDAAWWGNGLRLQRNIDDVYNSCYIDFGAAESNAGGGSDELGFGAGNKEYMRISSSGNVGIGTTTPGSYKLAVAGKIAATGEVKVFVDGTTTFPDYVFDPSYTLPTLEETEKYVKENHHLPEVPTAAEIAKEGMSLNEMNIILLKKVEELTLHLIEMKREIKELKENQKKQ